ncbi:MAG: DnaB-like helicase N-terminal domain-containing protein [Lyngbya sp.]|nr:DnaB-like helicase N-terminal domain-containing protein [Lyngbya sp.]
MIAQIDRSKQHKFRSNIEAEEAILGGILLDPNAIKRVEEILAPEAFSVVAHQVIYRAALTVHERSEQVDLMSLTTWLADTNQLEVVGGQMKLAQLVDRTVSAVNIDQYAGLVIREFLFRKLTQVGHEIAGIASEATNPQDILEEVENKVVSITRSYKAGMFEKESLTRFRQISKHLERIEDEHDDDPALKEWELRQLASEYEFKNVRDLLNFHAKWLQSRKTKRSVGLQEFWEQNSAPNQWIMRGFIPRKSLNLLWGTGGVGKTLLTGSICKKLITGESWADYPTEEPTEVLLIETDQGKNITAMQLDVQGFLDCSDVEKSRFRVLSDWNLEEFGVLRRELSDIRERSPNAPVLVVIDSLTSVSTNSLFSENDKEFARPLERLREIADRFDCSFLILHHGSKQGTMRGTTAIHNSADQVFKLTRAGKEKGIPMDANLEIEKSRYRLEGTYRLKYLADERTWEMQGRVINIEGIEGPEESIESASVAFQKIYRFLEENRGTRYQVKELSELVNISETTIRSELSWGIGEGLIDFSRSREKNPSGGRRALLFSLAEVSGVSTEVSKPTDCENCENSEAPHSKGLTVSGKPENKFPKFPNQRKSVSPEVSKVDEKIYFGNCENPEPAHGKDLTALRKSKNQFPQFSNQVFSENPENQKKPTVKTVKTAETTETPHSKGFSGLKTESPNFENCENSNRPPSKGSSDFVSNVGGIKDYYSLKRGDILIHFDTIGDSSVIQLTKPIRNMWETSKAKIIVSLADWQNEVVRRPTAEDIAHSIRRNPSRKWFRWLYRNLEELQTEAIRLIEDSELVEQCYQWLNPLELNDEQKSALDDLRKALIENGKISQKKYLKTWGDNGAIAIQFAEEEGRVKVVKDWIQPY